MTCLGRSLDTSSTVYSFLNPDTRTAVCWSLELGMVMSEVWKQSQITYVIIAEVNSYGFEKTVAEVQ